MRQSEIWPKFNFPLLTHIKHLFTTERSFSQFYEHVLQIPSFEAIIWSCSAPNISCFPFIQICFILYGQFWISSHKPLVIADGNSLPTLNTYSGIHLEITMYYGVWNNGNLDQSGKEDLLIPTESWFVQHTAPKLELSHKYLGIDCSQC